MHWMGGNNKKGLCNNKLIDTRIGKILEGAQSIDQAGFRSGFGCPDHLFTLGQLAEKAEEYQSSLWIAAVDFQKAFDSVEHSSIWASLSHLGVPSAYVRILASLYSSQTGEIITDRTSKCFPIRRGTKQGDPLSPKLFNSVLEIVMREIKCEWESKGYGLPTRAGCNLSNLRFADDILLIGKSKEEVQCMLSSLAQASRRVGLQIHLGKTKILTNVPEAERVGTGYVNVGADKVDILPFEGAVMYLGRSFSFCNMHSEELRHRIARGWAKFHQFKSELCCRHIFLPDRLRLFEAVVTPSVLYACGTWTLTADGERLLQGTQRKMLRQIVRVGRRMEQQATANLGDTSSSSSEDDSSEESEDVNGVPGGEAEQQEPWLDWLRRWTHIAEGYAQRAKVSDWVRAQKKQSFLWAGHLARRTDGRWSHAVLTWTPEGGSRKVGHPKKRWIDSIKTFLHTHLGITDWIAAAADRETWARWAQEYAEKR